MKSGFFAFVLFVAGVSATPELLAKAPPGVRADGGAQRYIVVLEMAPLAEWHGTREHRVQSLQSGAAGGKSTVPPGPARLDVNAPESRAYLNRLDDDFNRFRGDAERALRRDLQPVHRYRNALHGFSARLTAAEAERLAALPGVKRVEVDRPSKLHTDAGPQWIGADDIWNGEGLLPEASGEGVVIGIIDSGINHRHTSFDDPGEGIPPGNNVWDHVNPYGSLLGLCTEPDLECNDKLVGIYEFVSDDDGTEVVEEPNQGIDNTGHGSNVASIAAGNPLNLTVRGVPTQVSGVAPNANIISYRVCYIGDPNDGDDDGCQNSAILAAIDQAIADEVDVINYSIGTNSFSPWVTSSTPEAFLNAFAAGVFVVTSAGNEGSGAGTIGSPANAPWIMAAGNASHNRVFGSRVDSLSGGDTMPPESLLGASLTAGTTIRAIVHARDYGNALCGTGEPELQPTCDGNTGATNPFAPGTFDGEIVVCDRGDYGRVEKGKNLMMAGAGGYILANTDEQGSSIVADEHCLPATHITDADGDQLRAWLDSGSGHMGRISGFNRFTDDDAGDVLAISSSRGPNLPPAQDVLKPNLIAPGITILGAFNEDDDVVNNFAFLTGTSMSSPHLAGAAALLLSVDDSWTPSMLSSTLELTATAERAIDFDGTVATPHKRGAGRPQLADAASSGLFMAETRAGYLAANPNTGGDPRNLNLPGLVDSDCRDSCSFTRTVSAIQPNRTWTATPVGFPAGVGVTVTPSEFLLPANDPRTLTIDIDLEDSGQIGQWVYGNIRLTANNMPEANMTVAVFASGGDLPVQWDIASDRDSGWQEFQLGELTSMPDATLTSGGLVRPRTETQALALDPTNDNPFDGGAGVFTVLHDVPEGALWLHAETLDSSAPDLDLFVGRDSNGDGIAQQSEQVCSSITPFDLEVCDIFAPPAGTWWIVVQNWSASGAGTDDATLVSAVVDGAGGNLSATGQGIVPSGQSFPVRVAWDNVNAATGEEFLGAVGIGTDRAQPNNIGIVPVRFSRTGVSNPRTLVLMPGQTHGLAVRANNQHNRMFVDIPPGVDTLTVTATGATASQSNALGLDLVRLDFDAAFSGAPFAANAPGDAPAASASGSGGNGPVATISGGVEPGRWYAVVSNALAEPVSVDIRADVESSGTPIALRGGLWDPASRPGISQGYEYSEGGGARAMVWYTYHEDNSPVWYLAADLVPDGNVWVADLLRFTNDGANQQFVKVGKVVITMLDGEDSVFSFSLFGEHGSDRMRPTVPGPNTCPMFAGEPRSLTGLWYNGVDGLGGASVLYNDIAHVQVHYLFDQDGNPRWLFGATPEANNLSFLQFSGFCAVCIQGTPTFETVGVLSHDFTSQTNGSWSLDYMLNPPLAGDVTRSENIFKITNVLDCE